MDDAAVLDVFELGRPWKTFDPFLFCMHHLDAYPAGNEALGPAGSLAGRNIGMDFGGKDGWSMYHGDTVPGFPRHPHRGFETITLARSGFIDHSDSLGATARFGHGDVQWMTAGSGIVHAEMFPLVHTDAPNPTELFQIWLNLPRADKMVDPHFAMLWAESIPRLSFTDDDGRKTDLTLIAGTLAERVAPDPPPSSWAARKESEIAIFTIRQEPGARWTLPPASPAVNRTLYCFRGAATIAGRELSAGRGAKLRPDAKPTLVNADAESEYVLLQGRPLDEPAVQYGPFVMNTAAEVQQALLDYRRTQFGGWPWPTDAPTHARDQPRFAVHQDGRKEQPA